MRIRTQQGHRQLKTMYINLTVPGRFVVRDRKSTLIGSIISILLFGSLSTLLSLAMLTGIFAVLTAGAEERTIQALLKITIFALLGWFLTAVGIYGLLRYLRLRLTVERNKFFYQPVFGYPRTFTPTEIDHAAVTNRGVMRLVGQDGAVLCKLDQSMQYIFLLGTILQSLEVPLVNGRG